MPADAAAVRERTSHYEWLDLVRFLAALLVVAGHVRGTVFREYSALATDSRNLAVASFFALSRLGHEAVIVFFVLSGFLVGGRAFERIAQGRFAAGDYAIDRITRIWIPLIPALVLGTAIAGGPAGPVEWAGNLLGLQHVLVEPLGGNAPLWSLAYEIWFYALVYAVGRLAASNKMDPIALVILCLFVLVFTKLELQYLACWLIGALFYLKAPRLAATTSLKVGAAISGLAIIGLQLTSDGSMRMADVPPGSRAGLEILLAVGAGTACATLARMKSAIVASLAPQVAAMSYTLYLTHYPLLGFMARSGWQRAALVDGRSLAVYGLVLAGTLLAAWLLYLPFERQTGRVRTWLKSLARGRAVRALDAAPEEMDAKLR